MECYSLEEIVLDREFWKSDVSYGFAGLDVLFHVLTGRSSEIMVLKSPPRDIPLNLAQR